MNFIKAFVFGSLAVFQFAFAAPEAALDPSLQGIFDRLGTVGVNYKTEGVVCEQIARLQLHEQFPEPRYQITTGVEYLVDDRIVGELDLVVVDRQTSMVILLGEVKCWRSLDKAMDKAKSQRDRFLWTYQQNKSVIVFRPKEKQLVLKSADFEKLQGYIFVSQVGGKKWGFTQELPYRLSELESLQEHLIQCQKKNLCPLNE